MPITVSPYLWAIILGWLIAHGIKYVIESISTRSFRNFRRFYLSGNMPSSHSATTVALATAIGLIDGMQSVMFAIAVMLAMVVMYDAMMVRRSAGEQGLALRQLLTEQKSTILLPRMAKGHTPLEVLAGAVLGVIIGLVVFLATK